MSLRKQSKKQGSGGVRKGRGHRHSIRTRHSFPPVSVPAATSDPLIHVNPSSSSSPALDSPPAPTKQSLSKEKTSNRVLRKGTGEQLSMRSRKSPRVNSPATLPATGQRRERQQKGSNEMLTVVVSNPLSILKSTEASVVLGSKTNLLEENFQRSSSPCSTHLNVKLDAVEEVDEEEERVTSNIVLLGKEMDEIKTFLSHVWGKYDTDHSKSIDLQEVQLLLGDFTVHPVDLEDCQIFLDAIDDDGNQNIEYEELVTHLAHGIRMTPTERAEYARHGKAMSMMVDFFTGFEKAMRAWLSETVILDEEVDNPSCGRARHIQPVRNLQTGSNGSCIISSVDNALSPGRKAMHFAASEKLHCQPNDLISNSNKSDIPIATSAGRGAITPDVELSPRNRSLKDLIGKSENKIFEVLVTNPYAADVFVQFLSGGRFCNDFVFILKVSELFEKYSSQEHAIESIDHTAAKLVTDFLHVDSYCPVSLVLDDPDGIQALQTTFNGQDRQLLLQVNDLTRYRVTKDILPRFMFEKKQQYVESMTKFAKVIVKKFIKRSRIAEKGTYEARNSAREALARAKRASLVKSNPPVARRMFIKS